MCDIKTQSITYIFIKYRCIAELILLSLIKLKVIFLHERLLKILEFILCGENVLVTTW